MSLSLIEGVFEEAASARTGDDLLGALVGLANRHDYPWADIIAVVDRPDGTTLFESLHHLPTGYLDTYFRDDAKVDPVMQHLKSSALPIAWNRATYRSADMHASWEEMAGFGMVAGTSIATHLPNGRHLVIALDRDSEHPASTRRLTAMLAEMQLFMACAIESTFRILAPTFDTRAAPMPRLTPREREALLWTLAGKTAWETGRIMSIAERTVFKHTTNACAKLGCVNKFQAAMRAQALGLIQV
jgi:DNA-binding CsgD family transcriptional regulator